MEEKRREIRTQELSLRWSSLLILMLSLLVMALLFYYMFRTAQQFTEVRQDAEDYAKYQTWTKELEDEREYLYNRARTYTVTLDPEQVILYFNELSVENRRDNAYTQLTETITDARVLKHLESVMTLDNAMREREMYAMRLAAEVQGTGLDQFPSALQDAMQAVTLRDEDLRLSAEERVQRARSLVFDTNYENLSGQLHKRISLSLEHLLNSLKKQELEGTRDVDRLLRVERGLIYVLTAMLLISVVFIFRFVIDPLRRHVSNIENEEMLEPRGASELIFLAKTYNTMLRQVQTARKQLSFEARHDSLTGLYNRNAYDGFLLKMQEEEMALLILDVDHFKSFNDSYGHEIGDKVLRRVSVVLQHSFREDDLICRIGGDEFAVLMPHARPSMAEALRERIQAAAAELKVPLEDIPKVTLSVGAAFSASARENRSLFKCADIALYQIKHQGGDGCMIYEEDL